MLNEHLNIVITAGGTVESIDEVRSINNLSSGKLGSYLCSETIKLIENNPHVISCAIHYIVAKTAIKPHVESNDKISVKLYEVTDTNSIKNTVEELLNKVHIDYFIHSMAISDFTPKMIVDVNDLVQELYEKVMKIKENSNEAIMKAEIDSIIRNPRYAINRQQKVSSKADVMMLLEKTPKIISLVKDKNKQTYLVGFKLLRNVEEAQLIEAANKLTRDNGCDLVLANDLQYIIDGEHIGLLIKSGKVINRFNGKQSIAKGIIEEMFRSL